MLHKEQTWQIDIARHLLGTLDDDRETELRAYIESGDARTVQLRDEARIALIELLDALEPSAPPLPVRQRLMDRIEKTDQSDAVVNRGARLRHTAWAPGSPTVASIVSRRLRVPASIAAVVAILVVFGSAMLVNRPSPSNTVAQAQSSHNASETSIAALNDAVESSEAAPTYGSDVFSLAGMMDTFFDVIPLQTRDLDATLPVDAALDRNEPAGRLLWDRKHQVCYVFTPMLEPAGSDDSYQLWFTAEQSKPMSVGQFNVDASGWGLVRVNLPSRDLSVARASISRQTGDDTSNAADELLIGHFSR